MDWHSIESHRISCIKTALALENNDPEYQEALQNHMSVFDRYPCYEYLDGLRQLKGRYPDQLAHVNLPEDHPIVFRSDVHAYSASLALRIRVLSLRKRGDSTRI